MKYIFCFSFFLLLFTACKKNDSINKIVIDTTLEDTVDIEKVQEKYNRILSQPKDGWYVNYRPNKRSGTVLIFMKFSPYGTVNIQSDFPGYTWEQNGQEYKIGGTFYPELILKTKTVWDAVNGDILGDFNFLIQSVGDSVIELAPMKGGNQKTLRLRKVTSVQKDRMANHLQVQQKLEYFFSMKKTGYKNFVFNNYKTYWSTDLSKRAFTFSRVEKLDTFRTSTKYWIIDDGIEFIPAIKRGGVVIDSIHLRDIKDDSLHFSYVKNGEKGSFSFSNKPLFPYPGAADYFFTALPGKLQGNIQDGEADVSENMLPEFKILEENIDGFKYIQLYLFPPTSSSTNYIAALNNPGDGNHWNAFYLNVSKGGEGYLNISLKSKNSGGNTYSDDITPFFNKLFTDEGVTVIPMGKRGTHQLVKLESRKDSRNYIILYLWYPSNYYYEP